MGNTTTETKDQAEIDSLATESGLAVSIVDSSKAEISVSNNNSICQNLNPGTGFSKQCAKYCGAAYDKATTSGKTIRYECHAGLECRALAFDSGERPLVAIIGRTFISTEKYRLATNRAISGDWRDHPPNKFFENVLLSGSTEALEDAVKKFRKIASRPPAEPQIPAASPQVPDREPAPSAEMPKQDDLLQIPSSPEPPASGTAEQPPYDIRRWRSFFGSMLNFEYSHAASEILKFVAEQFHLEALVWLDKRGGMLESSTAYGTMQQRRLRVGIAADDERLIKSLADGKPLELNERTKRSTAGRPRIMSLFPIGVADTPAAAIAVLDPLKDEAQKEQIFRFCRSIASQLEILRLRNEVARGDHLATAVRRFSESLKRMDNEDLWLSLTQNAAEMMRAERSSLLIFDEKSGSFRIKAILGTATPPADETIGERVSKFVFTRKRAIAVADVSKIGISPTGDDRRYKTTSFLSSPISVGGRTIGVMNFTDRAGGEAFDRASLELFEAIAPQLAVAIDRAELKEKAGQFEQLSVTDALTGLLNRRYIEERLLEEIKRSTRHGYPMSFMMLDVDEFKSYNDSYGHPAGDEALKLVGSVIRDTLRGADVAARFGGEEFSILLPQTTSGEARTIADRIRQNIQHTKFPHRAVTVSIGVASCSAELCIKADLVSAADQALYQAKRGGRNRVISFEDITASRRDRKN